MIARVSGTLLDRQIDQIEVLTAGGVGYAIHIPLSTYETLPPDGSTVSVLTELVVREDGWQLYGFATPLERAVFRRLLTAKGFGAALALGMLSTLQRVPRVGRKKAEQLSLDLADKLDGLAGAPSGGTGSGAAVASAGSGDDAVRAVAALGYPLDDAMRVVRNAREHATPGTSTADIIRQALLTLA
jgi:holliday junction DNA helicase RuvA